MIKNNRIVDIIKKDNSLLSTILLYKGCISDDNPSIKAILQIFEPITFAIAKSLDFINAAFTLTKSSGSDVAKDIIVNPIMALFILVNLASITDPCIIVQPPINNNIIDIDKKKDDVNNSIYFIKFKYN